VTGLARALISLACTLILSSQALAIDGSAAFSDVATQARYDALAHNLRCLVCQNQSIADSNAELAADLRRQVREMIAAGQSDQQIKLFMTERYGDFVLYEPPFSARTSVLWAAPLLLLLACVGGAWRVIRRRSQQPIDDASTEDVVGSKDANVGRSS
jgi:cytochrome c-type biogenesis protein CcmH